MRLRLAPDLEIRALSKAEALYIHREVFTEDCYLGELDHLGPRPVVLDVGANIGLFALRLLREYPEARLHCFEPAPPTFEVLAQNLYGRPVKLHRLGLSDRGGKAELSYYPRAPGNSSLRPRVLDGDFLAKMGVAARAGLPRLPIPPFLVKLLARFIWARPRRFEVPLLTLSSFLGAHPELRVNLLKIDVERAELAVLTGVGECFDRIDRLVVEVTSLDQPGDPLKTTVELLRERGYQVKVVESELNRRVRRAIEADLGVDGRIDHLVVARRESVQNP